MNRRAPVCSIVALLLGTFLLGLRPATAQSTTSVDSGADASSTVAGRLVEEALQNNLSLRQERIGLKQSRTALAQTRGQYLPSLDLQARYTRARGGRTIDFPAGDLVNPAYRTLEEITQGRQFPTVENQEIQFLREKEQETILQLRQPLYRPEIRHGTRARKHEMNAKKASVKARRRALARDVKVAYYRYRKAQARVEILEATRSLVRETQRTKEKLLEAEKVTKDAVHRAEAEVLAVQQKLQDARTSVAQARHRLNVLRNRPADAPIPQPQTDAEILIERRTEVVQRRLGRPLSGSELVAEARPSLVPATRRTSTSPEAPSSIGSIASTSDQVSAFVEGRPELDRLDAAVAAADAQRKGAQTEFLPTVSLAVDAGIQGETYGFSGDRPFARASVVLEWNLFDGLSDHRRVQRRRLEAKRLWTQREEVARKLGLEARTALEEVRVARQSLQTAEARVTTTKESFRLTRRRHDVGRANQATLIDARTALTEAELNLNVTRYDLLIHLAELEHAAGLAPIGSK